MADGNFTTKEMLVRLMSDVREVRDNQIIQTGELTVIKNHTAETNGKVAQAIRDLAALEVTVFDEDRKQFWKLTKYGGIALVLSAFIFVKESRDFILQVLGIF
jgi:hypothetical protein